MIYVPGLLRELHPSLFEGVCLVEGLRRLGFDEREGADVRVKCEKTSTPEKALLTGVGREDLCLIVRLEGPKAGVNAIAIVSAAGEQYAETSFEDRVRWTAVVGKVPEWTEGDFVARWVHAVEVWNACEERERERMWEGSRARKVLDGVREVLWQKGFDVRAVA